MTLGTAISKKRIPKIESYRPEVKDSASIDLEWVPYKGKYEHDKTKIFAPASVPTGARGLSCISPGIMAALILRKD